MNRLDVSALGFDGLIEREWVAANGLGGYASSTLCGLNTRKYHGLLVAAMTPPVRRMVLLSRVDETILADGKSYALACNEYPGVIHPQGQQFLRAFSPEPFPRWGYQGDGWTVEKSLRLVRGQNTVCLSYTLLGGDKPIDLELRPMLAMRGIHELMYQWNARLGAQIKSPRQCRIPPTTRTPEVFLAYDGAFRAEPLWYLNTIYRREEDRGYGGLEDLWTPGVIRWTLAPGQTVNFACSADPIELAAVLRDMPEQEQPLLKSSKATDDDHFAALLRAADSFVVSLPQENAARKPVTVIAQYPWAGVFCRPSLISFAGLFLIPGRFDEGRTLLESLAGAMRDGLIPSEYPEDGSPPLYHAADTSLWFANAVHEYLRYTADDATGRAFLLALETMIETYRRGTQLGIVMDADGLLASRVAGVSTSWMDAKVGDWVITPRQGRTVELNALWYNALRICADLAARFGQPVRANDLLELAEKVKASFNRRFWNEDYNCCYDVVDDHGPDPSIRPNQLLAISLPYPVLSLDRHEKMLDVVQADLLTPLGVRTLSPHDPAYQGRYAGNVVSRDRAQHQGSVYPWMLGPMITAFVKVNGRGDKTLRQTRLWLGKCLEYLHGDGMGQLCELFDGDAPHRAGGAPASASSVAEILRCYAQDILGMAPPVRPKTAGPAGPPIEKPPIGIVRKA